MAAVGIYAAWERYAEDRLVVALCRSPEYFLRKNEIRAVRHVSKGLARVIVCGTGGYFDVRSVDDLIRRSNNLVDRADNPFRKLEQHETRLIDFLASLRNLVAHQSAFALAKYRDGVKRVYGMKSIPLPGEFLHAVGRVPGYTVPRCPRISGLAFATMMAITNT
jgi:hypothetical protein